MEINSTDKKFYINRVFMIYLIMRIRISISTGINFRTRLFLTNMGIFNLKNLIQIFKNDFQLVYQLLIRTRIRSLNN